MTEYLPGAPSARRVADLQSTGVLSVATHAPRIYHGESDVRRFSAALRWNWWVLLVCMALGAAGGWFITQRMPLRYEATATLRLSEPESVIPGMKALEQLSGRGSEVNTEQAVLSSRSMARRVVDSLRLRVAVRFPRGAERDSLFGDISVASDARDGRYVVHTLSDTLVELVGPDSSRVRAGASRTMSMFGLTLARAHLGQERRVELEVVSASRAVSDLVDDLRISRLSRDANILSVRYVGRDPALAERVPNALVSTYVARRATSRKTGARSTVAFLQQQLDTIQRQLRASQDSLRRFKELDQNVAIDQQTTVGVSKMAETQAERSRTAAELHALEATLDSARREAAVGARPAAAYRRLLAFPTLLRTAAIPSLLQSLTALENERATLLVRRLEGDRDVVALSRQIDEIEGQVEGIVRTYVTGLREETRALDQTLAQSRMALSQIPAKEVTLALLLRSTTVLGELSTVLQQRLKEAQIAEAVDDASAEVVDMAERPNRPMSPRPLANLALGVVIGLVIGALVTWLRERASRSTVYSRGELHVDTGGLPVLGVVPRLAVAAGRKGRTMPAMSGSDLHSPAMEAYRAMRTSLAFVGNSQGPQVLLVTSPVSEDGKSTAAAHLASVFAQQHLRTLVIDADMRRGRLHSMLGAAAGPGLSDYLTGAADEAMVVQRLSPKGTGPVSLVSRGAVPSGPAELLASPEFDALVRSLRPHYDRIVIDSPPVNVVSDSLILARVADGVVVVTRGGRTKRGALRFALDQLASVRAPVVGTVLNDYDVRRAGEHGDEYHRYFYGARYESTKP